MFLFGLLSYLVFPCSFYYNSVRSNNNVARLKLGNMSEGRLWIQVKQEAM